MATLSRAQDTSLGCRKGSFTGHRIHITEIKQFKYWQLFGKRRAVHVREETLEEKDRALSSSTVTSRRPIVHKGGNSRWSSGVQSNREGLGLVASKAADPGAHSAFGADEEHDKSLGGVWSVHADRSQRSYFVLK
jgi:hypothetical protein